MANICTKISISLNIAGVFFIFFPVIKVEWCVGGGGGGGGAIFFLINKVIPFY